MIGLFVIPMLGNKITYLREKYRIQHDSSNLNKAIKQIEQVYVMSGEEKELINRVWSLIQVKSNSYTVLILNKLMICSVFL